MQRHIWTFADQLFLIVLCSWAKTALVRLHICTDSSEPSLINYTSHIMKLRNKRSGETAQLHTLIWNFADQLFLIFWRLWWDCTYAQSHLNLCWRITRITHAFVLLSNENSGETVHMHILIWSLSGLLYFIFLCSWAMQSSALVRLFKCAHSSESSLAKCTLYLYTVELWKHWFCLFDLIFYIPVNNFKVDWNVKNQIKQTKPILSLANYIRSIGELAYRHSHLNLSWPTIPQISCADAEGVRQGIWTPPPPRKITKI